MAIEFSKIIMIFYNLARSSNGRTIDSESIYPRSNRGWAARLDSDGKNTLDQFIIVRYAKILHKKAKSGSKVIVNAVFDDL